MYKYFFSDVAMSTKFAASGVQTSNNISQTYPGTATDEHEGTFNFKFKHYSTRSCSHVFNECFRLKYMDIGKVEELLVLN